MLAQRRKRLVDAAELVELAGGHAALGQGRFGAVVNGGVGDLGGLFEPLHVLQHAAPVFERGILIRRQRGGFDFLALKGPQIEQTQLFLLGALELVQLFGGGAPLAAGGFGLGQQIAVGSESVQHGALRVG